MNDPGLQIDPIDELASDFAAWKRRMNDEIRRFRFFQILAIAHLSLFAFILIAPLFL